MYVWCVQVRRHTDLAHTEAAHQRRQGWREALGAFLGLTTGPWERQDCLQGRQVTSQLTSRYNMSSTAIQPH